MDERRRVTGRLAAAVLAQSLRPCPSPEDAAHRLVELAGGDERALARTWHALCDGPGGDRSPGKRAGQLLGLAIRQAVTATPPARASL